MKNQNKTWQYLKSMALFVLFYIFFLQNLKAQPPSIFIQADTILVDSVAKGYNFTYGVNTNVNVDIFWFVPDSTRISKAFQKELKSVVRKEVRNRFVGINGFIYVSNYDFDSSKVNTNLLNYAGSGLDSGIQSGSAQVGFRNKPNPRLQPEYSAGDYLVKAGKSYNVAIGASIISAVFSAVFIANGITTGAYVVLSLGTSMALISNIIGNNNLIDAGKSMKQPQKRQ
ncbi:MAG: hypothetical protein EBX50_18955 [Chitinophagia bacterium]|nr:hypothetical protein [Chitinophagia bacterium]